MGMDLQCKRYGAMHCLEQQGSLQANANMGRTLHHRGGTSTKHTQASEGRQASFLQRNEHRAITSFLPIEMLWLYTTKVNNLLKASKSLLRCSSSLKVPF
jgi:hypothetical protein